MVMDDEETSLLHPTPKITGYYLTVFVTQSGLKFFDSTEKTVYGSCTI